MASHVIKYDHRDGEKLNPPESWCGVKIWEQWHFLDAQHAAISLSQDSMIQPCKNCTEAIIVELQKNE